jgi:16S rRNA (guanine966-N2)-methyltransferase
MGHLWRPKSARSRLVSLRIVGGSHGSRKIDTPDTTRTHPMGDRIRSALFNKIAAELPGAVVLDAFAGSGALGIEAISRGAAHATFIERDRIAQKVIAKNIDALGVRNQTKLIRTSVSAWLDTMEDQKFDIIFADPPYHDEQFSTVTRLLDLLKPGALMVLSHSGRSESPTKSRIVVVDNRSYGDATLTFYRLEDD